jgi:hypothetical protein
MDDDAGAGGETRRPAVDHLAGDVASGDMRELRDSRNAAALPEVQMVERAGADPHDRVARRRRRLGHVALGQHVRAAMRRDGNRESR